MCTLTAVPLPGSRLRLAFNRDERPTRAAGLPPEAREVGGRRAVFPTDPEAGGTWLAVNDAGLALATLNVTPPWGKGPPGRRSRGGVIPGLLGCDTPAAALATLGRVVHYPDFAPFRLVLVGGGVVADVRWDGREAMVLSRLLGGAPVLFTSSGLGDHVVEGVRRALFDEAFAGTPDGWEAAQDAFHRHAWPGREHLSVNMTRASAQTVSHAVVDVTPAEAMFTYYPAAPDRLAEARVVHLPLATAGVA